MGIVVAAIAYKCLFWTGVYFVTKKKIIPALEKLNRESGCDESNNDEEKK